MIRSIVSCGTILDSKMKKTLSLLMTLTKPDYAGDNGEAYIQLSTMTKGISKRQSIVDACDSTGEVKGQIILDFDSSGRLIGIEFLEARSILPREILEGNDWT